MAFEIVDGMTGQKHISSDDLSALNIATIGKADCVLKYGDDFKLTMASANSATLGTGVGMVGGKRFWNQAATSLTVQSGTQGQKRNDLVVARYAKTREGAESITPVVIKGTPTTGNATDPATTSNDLKLWRIPLDGISVGTPVKLFDTVTSLATLGDSVSHTEVHSETYSLTNDWIATFTPKVDCDVFVLCAASGVWGYDGAAVTMGVDCSQLEAVSKHVGKFSGGNTQHHQLTSWGVFRGAKAGTKYSFKVSMSGDPQGDRAVTSICMAVNL